jgi:hypothetical protein
MGVKLYLYISTFPQKDLRFINPNFRTPYDTAASWDFSLFCDTYFVSAVPSESEPCSGRSGQHTIDFYAYVFYGFFFVMVLIMFNCSCYTNEPN